MAIHTHFETTTERIKRVFIEKRVNPRDEAYHFFFGMHPKGTGSIDNGIICGCLRFLRDDVGFTEFSFNDGSGIVISDANACISYKHNDSQVKINISNINSVEYCSYDITDRDHIIGHAELMNYHIWKEQAASMMMEVLARMLSYYYNRYYVGIDRYKW